MIFRFLTLAHLATAFWLLFPAGQATAQVWVKDMFPESVHDFGTVPRGAKAEYEFKFVNKYQEDVHVARVSSSCGCTSPRIGKGDLKTYQEGSIICEFNTRSFVGPKAATVTVFFDRPFSGQMQLTVKGNIRSDIVTEPGEIQFGELERGSEKALAVNISYAGRNRWEITDVLSANPHLGVSLERADNPGGRVEYEMRVRLKDSAPSGEFTNADQIVLVTNDDEYNMVTIPVRGRIMPPLDMADSVELGTIKLGQAVRKTMFVKSNQEFEVTKVECGDERFSFSPDLGKKSKFHKIPLEFSSIGNEGAFREKVSVYTNLPADGVVTTMVSGNVIE
jgi:hypothetical protein